MNARPIIALLTAFAAGALLKGCDEREVATPAQRNAPTAPREYPKLIELVHVEGQREIAPDMTLTALRFDDPLIPTLRATSKACYVLEHREYRSVHVICDGMTVGGGGREAALESAPRY